MIVYCNWKTAWGLGQAEFMGARFSTRRTVPKFDPHGGGADGFAEYTIRAVSMQNSILAEIPHRNGDRVKSLARCQCRITYSPVQTT